MMSKPANKIFDGSTALAADQAAAVLARSEGAGTTIETEVERTDFPCSVSQERFWLLDRLDPGNASYNVAVRWRLEGRVSTDLLERAWLAIIERHEILRTVFLEIDGAPVQRIMPASPFRMAEIDLSTLPAEQQSVEGDRIGMIEARAPFDVQAGPLIRATLLRFSSTLSIILVTTHQIVSDGWSIGVMAREMGVIYDALRHDHTVPLEPLPIQYADYSLWQLEWLQVRGTAAETAYWTKQLAGVKPFKVLPDRPRPAMATTNGVIVSRVLPRELTNRAQNLCAERGATLFAAALGALCAMLSRYTREEEIVLGTQVSDRNQVELEGMIGQFVNSLILRNDLSGDPRFVEVIDRVRDTTAQALDHRHIPIERLLGMVKGEHGRANAPPISVNFIFQKTFIQNVAYSDFSLIDMPSLPAGAIYDLNFFMVERPDGWRFSLQYNTDQFEHDTANRMLGYFQNVLESAAAEPQRRVSELRVSADEESRRLLQQINQARPAHRESRTVAALFESHVAVTPGVVAVTSAGAELTYDQLNTHAELIAGGLRSRGIGLGSRVAICIERSPELVSLILALMKIGASCVLLDPSDPQSLIRRSVAAVTISAVAVRAATAAAWADSGAVVVDIDEVLLDRTSPKQLAAPPGVGEHTEAYIGLSPVRPEVGIRSSLLQSDLSTMLVDVGARIGLTPVDVIASVSTTRIDAAIAELLLPLVYGARLVIGSAKEAESPRALAQFLKRSSATVLHAAPPTWSALQQSGWSAPGGFRMLCSRGTLSGSVVQSLLHPGAELFTLYGPADRGVWSSIKHVQSRLDAALVGSPVGKASLDLDDPRGHLPAVGATARLLIVDQDRGFLEDSGDLARLRADGQIELLGRNDRRIAHRSYLFDAADMESILMQQRGVGQVLVAAGQQNYEGALVACVVPEPGLDATALAETLHAALKQTLPAALIPVVIVARDALPLERDGSLNWRKLHALDPSHTTTPADTPQNDIEVRLASIWGKLLDLPQIDPTANFFELGGHSLLAARMLTRVAAEFGRRVTLNALFRAPSIRELAQVIQQKDAREFDFRQMVKLQPNGSRPPLIAINNTGTYYPLAKCLGADQPVISLQLFDPSTKTDAMPQTLEEVAAGYVQLIQRVQPTGPYNLMGWCVAGALSFEIARQLTDAHKQVSSLYLMDAWVPGYIKNQPPLRRFISDYSLRWQLVRDEWRQTRAGRQTFSTFLDNRNGIKAVRGLLNRLTNTPIVGPAVTAEELSREDYDQWLLRYLQAITLKYRPGHFSGKLTLFRSLQEPTGWFFDPLAGWGPHADSVELVMVAGNHFTMFQEKGATEMAATIASNMTALKPAGA